ncbi:MAG TPA: hypothetical protein VG603_08080 [Chitinophagales bacterium]|nr:hypothetical protein [Chitinophagales bacterium]
MIFRIYRVYKTGKTLYEKVLKPVYEELRKDAYASDNTTPVKVKKADKYNRKKGVKPKTKATKKVKQGQE